MTEAEKLYEQARREPDLDKARLLYNKAAKLEKSEPAPKESKGAKAWKLIKRRYEG